MKLLEYHLYVDPGQNWEFDKTSFGRVNLIVGDSGTGKSRFINTLSHFAEQAIADKVRYKGHWKLKLEILNTEYEWEINVGDSEKTSDTIVLSEYLKNITTNMIIIDRTENSFEFNGTKLPKLSSSISSISLLKEEEEIEQIYKGFQSILTRRFFSDELQKNFSLFALPNKDFRDKYIKSKDLNSLLFENIGFHNKLLMLQEIEKPKYDELISFYKQVFPFIEDFKFLDIGETSVKINIAITTKVFCFKEHELDDWIPVHDISSGMQKVFLLALDVMLFKTGGILIIDEYENSLGINAINFFPELISSSNENSQFIISSHHPYLINKIPVDNWMIFNRQGRKVRIKPGIELKEKFGKSRQDQFIKLINEPFYSTGIK